MAPELLPLLEKYNITQEEWEKQGRPPAGVRQKREAVVTELHEAGTTWDEMCRITGFSVGTINRLTRAVGNSASRQNRVENAVRSGKMGKGRRKPWLSKKLESDWKNGKYDFHRGRIRSEKERATLREASTRPEVRKSRREAALKRWRRPEEREHLLKFHRSREERLRRSKAQSRRIQDDPVKWTRGKGSWVFPKKCSRSKVWVRSSYERKAIEWLDNDPTVVSYDFEPVVKLPEGRRILPDFLVRYVSGATTLMEVKASWVLKLPSNHKVQRRLQRARSYAEYRGWTFRVWTEKDFAYVG